MPTSVFRWMEISKKVPGSALYLRGLHPAVVRPGNHIHFVYAQNWLEDIFTGRRTLDRTAATKLVYTHRF